MRMTCGHRISLLDSAGVSRVYAYDPVGRFTAMPWRGGKQRVCGYTGTGASTVR